MKLLPAIFLLSFGFLFAEEPHLANVKQLTFGGENAEAYFSSDGKQLIFQSTRNSYPCDQIYTMNSDGTGLKKISDSGRTTCAYFYPSGGSLLYASTHGTSKDCPAVPDRSSGYVWPIYESYDIYRTTNKTEELIALAPSPGYDAEATISPDGKKIVFTSDRDGDLELYVMNADGSGVKRLTNSPGYDGGAFFSADSKRIVYRANHITDEKELSDYRDLLKQHLVRPGKLEIYTMNADGSDIRQVTHNNAANFCPFFHPDGKRIIFSSNMHDPSGRNFDLYLINADGTGLKRVTTDPTFDGFPMFSPDGKKLVFASNRNAKERGETNIFTADWIDQPSETSSANSSLELLKKHVSTLASDEMNGRLTGTPEARKAAEYIADQFKQYGFTPLPQSGSYFQSFSFTSGVSLGNPNTLSIATDKGRQDYKVGADFQPAGFSDDAVLKDVPLVFANYGIQSTALKHDDYAGLDVKGKAVLALRFGPEGNDPKSAYSQYYALRYKAMTAREKGAAALLIVAEPGKDGKLPVLRMDRNPGTAGLPVVYVNRNIVEGWLQAGGKTFPDPKNPHAGESVFELKGPMISLETKLVRQKSNAENVLAWLPATEKTDQVIVIGAHYDHLGTGIEGSLAPKWGEIHNGADDNASGVSAVLELARLFGTRQNELKRNLLLIAFSGEELGVLGSSHFVKNAPFNLKNITAMLNLDMVGRLRESKLVVGGTGTSPVWKQIMADAGSDALNISQTEDGYGPSDHAMFYTRDIPVLFFFTGAHPQYHRPEDDPATLNYEGLSEITNFVFRIADAAQKLPEAPAFTKVKDSPREGASRGFRVYLGTIPDYTEEVKGVKLSGVREGSPAEEAGLKAGDVIVEFAGKKIENIYDYTFALQDVKAGDNTTIVVLRGEQRLSLNAVLEARGSE